MLSHVISIPFIALHSTHTALQLPQSPLLPCRRNISFPANSYPLKRWKFHISVPLRSTTWIEKPLGLFWLFRELRRYNNTLYNNFYFIQICSVRTRTELSDSLHRILSEQRPEKTCRKKTRQEIWVGSMAHALKSPSYEGYTAGRTLPLFTKQVFQQRTANSK